MRIIKDKFEIIDEVSFIHRDKNGKVLKTWSSNNWKNRLLIALHLKRHQCIVNVGMANIAGLVLTDISGTAYDYMAIGSGTTEALPANTALVTQEGVRMTGANCVGTRVTTGGITNNTAQWVSTFSQALDATLTGIDAITEIGIFYDDVGVTVSMLMRQVFTAESIDWDSGDTIQFTVKVQVKQGT